MAMSDHTVSWFQRVPYGLSFYHFVAVTVCEGDQSRTLPRRFNLSDSSAKVHYVDFDPTLLLHYQRLGILQRRML
jgi:hypothetical protein